GVSNTDTSGVINAIQNVVNLRRLRAGQKVNLLYENNYFAGILLPMSTDMDVLVSRSGGAGFHAIEKYKELTTYPSTFHAVVDSSLYASCLDSGMTDRVIMEMIELFSYDVDFQRDIQRGNELSVTYEVIYDEDGNAVDTGDILYTSLTTAIHDLTIFRYTDLDGKTDYYNQDGQTVRKTLLKTPINGAYITSNFGPRVSPITGYNMVHKGVDFGAPRGTPIMSSGDGTVTYAGYNDVFGYHVRVRHVNGYETMYAHMSRFASGMRRGRVVNQGQTIGYVGTTGQSTGPHLHYEVRLNGTHINPSRMKFPPGRTLTGEEARLFQNMLASYESSLN
ncbi:MAG: M23 family metallopeptidase, partial [Spirochaetales bacterium]|nr:M23 family metallopeptidase [Spirochaetales bacterium]